MKVFVVVTRDSAPYREAIQAAGAVPLDALEQEFDGHVLARGTSGSETLARVRELAAANASPVATGGLDRATRGKLVEAGAAGVVLESALWLLPESPLDGDDRDAIAGLTQASFATDADVVLPSGIVAGRDALFAPFVARRARTLENAVRQVRADLGIEDATAAPIAAPVAAVVADPVPAPAAAVAVQRSGISYDDALVQIVALVSETTGYPTDLLDPTLDMEADLGIDTVKQAELFGTLRTRFGVPRDDSVKLKDYATLAAVAEYMSGQATSAPVVAPEAAPAPVAAPTPVSAPAPTPVPVAALAPTSAPARAGEAQTEPLDDAVAIIGLGAVMPGAPDAPSFWRNVLAGTNGIIEVPSDRWDPAVHWDADPSAEDRTYSKIGGFITDFEFDSLRFRIPPNTAKAFDPIQQMALVAATEALADAGYDERPFDRSRCAVILGNALGGERKDETTKRMHLSEFVAALRATSEWQTLSTQQQDALLQQADTDYRAEMPPITEDTMPGELSNIIAGRVANALDLHGKNFTTDAACASSHAALDAAVQAITSGDADMALWGGADRSMGPDSFVKFSKIGALSPNGSFPFDERADGFVMGEGAAIMLLKRLSLAIQDGDRVYAVVRGIGSSSDGAGKGITAPNPTGQKRAIQRAFDAAGVTPQHVQLVEAHGTGTKVGDVVEVSSLAEIFADVPAQSVALGSIKSQIGHLKSASGAAGLLKAALALHEKVLPPTINVTRPTPAIDWANVPFRINTELTAWPEPAHAEPRRAAVSSFGFGGTNFHVILEEYVPAYHDRAARTEDRTSTAGVPEFQDGPVGEMVLVGAHSPEALVSTLQESVARATATETLATAASSIRTPDGHALPHRLSLVALEHSELVRGLNTAAALLPDPTARRGLPLKVKGAVLGAGPRVGGKVAFLFPGQGSQYVNMCAQLAQRYPVVAETIAQADAVLEPLLGCTLSSIMFADASNSDVLARADQQLRRTEFTQPAVLVADVAIHRLLLQHGVPCDMVAGHSLGEYAALVAAGVLSFEDALLAVSARGEGMAAVKVDDPGLMASFSCGPDQVDAVLAKVDGYVVAANRNCPVQTVVAGASAPVRQAMELAGAAGIDTVLLNVSAAFHTSIVAPASAPLRAVLDRLTFNPPSIPVFTNVDATRYPDDADAQREILAHQVAAPVEWISELEALYDAGARTFVEVGPKRALSGFTHATLGDRPDVTCVLTNHPKRGDLASFLDALAQLGALGFDLDLPVAAPVPPANRSIAPAPALAPARVTELAPARAAVVGGDLDFVRFRAAAQPALDAALRQGHEQYSSEISRLQGQLDAFEQRGLHPYDVVVSGAAAGLPGESRRVFDDANFDRLFAGENRIDRVDAAGIQRILDKRVDRLIKDGGEPRLERAADASDVLQLAGRRGTLDMVADYGLAPRVVDAFDSSTELVVAAAYEALHDAGIPLVQQQITTQSGSTLPGKWALPQEMQADTGVICGSAFPGLDNFVEELSRSLAQRYAGRSLAALEEFYQELLDVTPVERRRELSAFYAKGAGELHALVGDERGLEAFSRDYLFRIISFGHAELSEAILARGPSTQINAACASTTQAIAIAEDWLRTGRCRRVLVVGGDDITSDNLLEWIGTGFLASGAATTAANVEDAALPFDTSRHGMIVGMGAVGLVIERREDVEARGIVPVARIVSTRIANSAHHRSRLDADHIAREAKALVETSARFLGVPVETLAPNTLFMSHETYTPARGGSASAEAAALRAACGSRVGEVLVTHTKGFTGHSMGAGIEDAVALKSLQFGKIPPIANLREQDPEFADLQLSRGGEHERRYAMRFSAGFGSQVALAFFEKLADGVERVADPARYQTFLDRCSGVPVTRTERVGRVLRVTTGVTSAKVATPAAAPAPPVPAAVRAPVAADAPVTLEAPTAVATSATAATRDEVLAAVVDLICEQTGYPADMLEPDLDLEADLGIDTVKQAEIFAQLRDRYTLARDESFALKEVSTLAKVADYLHARIQAQAAAPTAPKPLATRIDLTMPARGTTGLTRRVPRIVPMASIPDEFARRAFVVGDGELADELSTRMPDGSGDVVVFLGDARALFRFAKAHVTELEAGTLGVLAVTHMGGRHGIDVACRQPEDGAVTGLTKSLAMEFPKAWIRALDLDPTDELAMRAECIEAELRAGSSHVEVGRSRRDGRVVVKNVVAADADAHPASEASPRITSDSVVVVTGGARGITADILAALADRAPTLVLLGRTALPDPVVPRLDDDAIGRLRDEAKVELTARGERVTPVAIERYLAPFRARAEVAETLRTLTAAGARAEYHSVDVGDESALAELLADVRARHGAIHGVLHAAGVEESQPLVDKTEDAYERTWGPKAGAALLLARLTKDDDLRCFVVFGSVAGRFGNAAQADYSAANDCVAKLTHALRAQGVPATTICWGPWGERGMATRGSTLTVLESLGVDPLTTSEGVAAFLTELDRLDEAEVVLAKGLGALTRDADDAHDAIEAAPALVLERTLATTDPTVDHHRVDGVPFMAGVLGLRAFADASEAPVTGYANVQFDYPVKLLRDRTVDISVYRDEHGTASLTTIAPGPVPKQRTHFSARVLTTPAPSPTPRELAPSVECSFASIYPPFFHGPTFQVLDRATRVAWDGIEVAGRQPEAGHPDETATLEGAVQSLGLWGLLVAGVMALPQRIARIDLHGGYAPGDTTYRVTGARLEAGTVRGDVQCVVEGQVVAELIGATLIVTGPSPIAAGPSWWNSDKVSIGTAAVWRVPVEEARTLLERRELWAGVLGADEIAVLDELTVPKRRQEWLAATLAAKVALRDAGLEQPFPGIQVLRGESGAPIAHGRHGVTLSHAGGVAVAHIFDATVQSCGVDVEVIEPRSAAFEEEAFTTAERAAFPASETKRSTTVTTSWAGKEAVLKALGVGLSVDLHQIELQHGKRSISAELAGDVQHRYEALSAEQLTVRAKRDGSLVLAWADLRLAAKQG